MNENKKIFFITTNQTSLDKLIEYEIPNKRGLINLKAGHSKSELSKEIKFKNETYTVHINSMEISQKDLKGKDQDIITKKYRTTLILKYNKCTFSTDISFRASKNNFIYDIKFNEYKGWAKTYYPPSGKDISQLEQLKIYVKYLEHIIKKQDEIFQDLLIDSQDLSFGIYLDFFLEILKNCYATKNVILFLRSFELENILLPGEDYFLRDYEGFLKVIENEPKIITNYCVREEDKYQLYLNFITLLFYIKYNFEREKAMEMIDNKDLWKYFIKILPLKHKFFPKLKISDELINNMFEQELTIDIITGILNFCSSIEKILILINDKIAPISNCCLKEKKIILMSNLQTLPQKTDNLEIIIEEIKKIINYEGKNDKIFISFDEDFWRYFVHFNDDIRKLYIINSTIILCSQVDASFHSNNLKME